MNYGVRATPALLRQIGGFTESSSSVPAFGHRTSPRTPSRWLIALPPPDQNILGSKAAFSDARAQIKSHRLGDGGLLIAGVSGRLPEPLRMFDDCGITEDKEQHTDHACL
jgi:hypothetical protein